MFDVPQGQFWLSTQGTLLGKLVFFFPGVMAQQNIAKFQIHMSTLLLSKIPDISDQVYGDYYDSL